MYLNCHSYHSLRYGTIPLLELPELAQHHQVQALALTDINTAAGIYDFVKKCQAIGIKPLVGIEFRYQNKCNFIGLAKNKDGMAEMNKFLSHYNLSGEPLPDFAPNFFDTFVIYSTQNCPNLLQSHEYIGIKPHELHLLFQPQWKEKMHKMVVLAPVTFRNKQEYNLHRIFRAIDGNTLLSKLTPDDTCGTDEKMISQETLLQYYEDYPIIIENTQRIIAECNYHFEYKKRNKQHYKANRQEDLALLKKLTQAGLEKKYKGNAIAKQRAEKELKIIDQLGFSGYFLITWDIVQYSKSRGFLHIGRGSGANSIVSYCLGITNVCPLELDLYFERFLNLNRQVPPDFDIDWSWKERDEILQYIFDKYGRDHVAFCGTNVEFKYRSIFREVGKVFGLPKEELDVLATTNFGEESKNSVVNLVIKYGKLMEKYPNQRSMHACGILISEEPITHYSVLELPPKGFPIVQFDMHTAENIGLDKFDILSQRGIGHINDSVVLIKKNKGIDVDIRDSNLSRNHPACNEFLAVGKTIGCFYIESPAMRGLLRRLTCKDYKTLVAASSIIRPGVAQSGMMKEYIFRHNYPDRFEYFHDVFKEQLGETYGIMVYQEDVIKIALHFGGIAPEDGDILRRAMSGKGRSLEALQRVKDNFFASCAKQGHPQALTEEVYRQIESFAGYSFCKAHSASYAVESYQSLYLKVHFPLEFMVAVINNQGGFYRTEVYVHEAKMSGGTIHNPCVNHSGYETTLYGSDIYLGFMHLQGLQTHIAQEIELERERNGAYLSLENFIKRIAIGLENLQVLIFIDAFRFTGKSKNQLLVLARMLLVQFKPTLRTPMLLEEPLTDYTLPTLPRSKYEDAFDEIELLGFPISCSPFELLKTNYRGDVMANDLSHYHKKQVKMLAYLISRKHVPTKMGAMFFGTWIDANGEFFDTAHFADSLAKYPFQGGGCYLLLGYVEIEYTFPTITVVKMAKMPFIPDPRYSNDVSHQYKTQEQLKEDVSMTSRKPYPQEHEINLPRQKMTTVT